jgi:hypothetical protein
MLVFFIQAQVFRELSDLFESARPTHTDDRPHSAAYTLAKERKRAERTRYSKVVTWYFFAVTNYFLYGESIIYYFKHILLMDAYFLTFTKHHRFISFSLWTLGFVGFVTTLKKVTLRRQFGLFCWIHISLFLIVVSRWARASGPSSQLISRPQPLHSQQHPRGPHLVLAARLPRHLQRHMGLHLRCVCFSVARRTLMARCQA